MIDGFESTRKIPRLMIPYTLLRSKTFLDWNTTLDSKVWHYLLSYIVRSPLYTGKIDIYENYWKQGKLASRWSIKDLAEFLGYSSTSGSIEKALKRLHIQNFIIKRPERVGRSNTNVYEFGTHDFQGNETIYAFEVFNKIAEEEKLLVKNENLDRFYKPK